VAQAPPARTLVAAGSDLVSADRCFGRAFGLHRHRSRLTVTEVGRQPFIISGIMRTAEAVTPVPHLTIPLFTFTPVYLFLAFVVVFLLLRQFR
jgi:Cytochrome bd terminal oxidase subunit I